MPPLPLEWVFRGPRVSLRRMNRPVPSIRFVRLQLIRFLRSNRPSPSLLCSSVPSIRLLPLLCVSFMRLLRSIAVLPPRLIVSSSPQYRRSSSSVNSCFVSLPAVSSSKSLFDLFVRRDRQRRTSARSLNKSLLSQCTEKAD